MNNTAKKELRISGESARIIIKNAYIMLRRKNRGLPLWSLVGALTSHGSGYSIEICRSAQLDPHQICGPAKLKDFANGSEPRNSAETDAAEHPMVSHKSISGCKPDSPRCDCHGLVRCPAVDY